MSSRRILGFTSCRSEYDLMSGIYRRLNGDPGVELGLIVSGAHLSPTYGLTVRDIEADAIPIAGRIETLIDADTGSARLKTATNLMHACLHDVLRFAPDVITFAGDREDAIAAALIGGYLGIPTAHFFGGDHTTDGNIDNAVRHATSKIASTHFVAHERHVERLRKIGEPADRIFFVGSPALDKFVSEPRLSKEEVASKLGRPEWTDFALMIHHPTLREERAPDVYFEEVLVALKREGVRTFVGYPNTDPGSKLALDVIRRYGSDPDFCFYRTLDRTLFINLMRHARFMIGNSSAGIIEAPLVPLPAINVGSRQTGRLAAANVIFVPQDVDAIAQAIRRVASEEFAGVLRTVESPYGKGDSVTRTVELLTTLPFETFIEKREDPLDL